jgi:hypothetical protein
MRVDEAEGPLGRVALKRPRSPAHAPWLAREAALLASLPGTGLAEVLDRDGAGAWLALRLLPGPGLSRWARGRPVADVVEALACLADTLAALHAAGLAHGDVKPGNVIMGPDARPRLIDLGLAATPPGAAGFHGTYGAASPEQLRGAPPTPASDVFALGALAFRALTGGRPFTAQREAQALLPTDQLPWSPAMVRPGVPAALDALVLRMLDRHPERRPPAAGLGAALRAAAGDAPLRLHPVVFLHWRTAGRLLVAAADRGEPGLLVLFGPDGAGRAALREALCAQARREGLPVDPTGDTGLVPLSGPGAEARATVLADRGAPALVLVDHPTPLPGLARLGAVHLDTRLPARAPPPDGDTARLLDALASGPLPLPDLARRLGLGPHDVLDLAEPLLERGRLVEADGGARLALREA